MKKYSAWIGLLCFGLGLAANGWTQEERDMDKRGENGAAVSQGMYTKPVWRKMGKGTYMGGYADFEYRSPQDGKHSFDVTRIVPFIYADIAPNIRFATEIEFEHGGVLDEGDVEVDTTTGKGSAELSGESKIEFAVLDYELLGEALSVRGGILLIPIGKFNLIHDSPINDLTDRPLLSQTILPTTFSESGAGIFGSLYPIDPLKLDYQIYITQGFNGGATGSTITKANGLRNARSKINSDNNEKFGTVARIAISPSLGSEIGLSAYHSAYDNAGENALTILALDWGFQFKALEFLGEYANTQVNKDATIASTVPGRMEGYYGQVNFHFLQDMFRRGSTFTSVVRWDHANTDLSDPANSKQALTFGLNFRPIEQTVFKLNYKINYEDMAHTRIDNDAFIAGFATYF